MAMVEHLVVYTKWSTLYVLVNKSHIYKAVKKVGLALCFYTNVEERGRVDLKCYRHSEKEVIFFGDENEIEASGGK